MKQLQGIRALALTLAAACFALPCAPLRAQTTELPPAATPEADQDWYYRPAPPRVEQKSIAQAKAEQRAEQRMARLAASRWYGISNGRPTASGMPFTTMYSHAWQQPGGRPFAWHMSSRPVVVFQTAPAVYR
jgi:hypothetical protein